MYGGGGYSNCTVLYDAAVAWKSEFSDWLAYEVWGPYLQATETYLTTVSTLVEIMKGGDEKAVAGLKKYLSIVSSLDKAAIAKDSAKTASLALDHSSYGAQFIDRFCFSAGWTP